MPKQKQDGRGSKKQLKSAIDLANLRMVGPSEDLFKNIQEYRRSAQIKKPPALLYHYTNTNGLLGIVENNKIWATHISYLNDSSELLYAKGLVQEALERQAKNTASSTVLEFLRRARANFDLSEALDIFVSCFCEHGDLLSQWRGYAQAGEGYSIGVNAERLWDLGGYGSDFFFGYVEYEREAQERIIETILTMAIDGLRVMTDALSTKEASPRIDEVCKVLQQSNSLVTFKDAMFAAENEWRSIHLMTRAETEKNIRFRSAGSKLIPYVELDFANLTVGRGAKMPIVRIYHGPTLNPGLSVRGLKLLLAKHAYPQAEVLGSKIPLRV